MIGWNMLGGSSKARVADRPGGTGGMLGKGVTRPVTPEHWDGPDKCHWEEASGLGD